MGTKLFFVIISIILGTALLFSESLIFLQTEKWILPRVGQQSMEQALSHRGTERRSSEELLCFVPPQKQLS